MSATDLCPICDHQWADADRGMGCLAGWEWDGQGIATTVGCECEVVHLRYSLSGERERP